MEMILLTSSHLSTLCSIDGNEENPKKKHWWHQKYPLPYWCSYLSWTLAILTILISCWFVIFYSLEWDKQKSEQWLSSLLMSFIQSAALIQPIKVINPYSLNEDIMYHSCFDVVIQRVKCPF